MFHEVEITGNYLVLNPQLVVEITVMNPLPKTRPVLMVHTKCINFSKRIIPYNCYLSKPQNGTIASAIVYTENRNLIRT